MQNELSDKPSESDLSEGDGMSASGGTATCKDGACDPSWIAMAEHNAPAPRQQAAVAWTDHAFFVWGGGSAAGDLTDGGLYDPATGAWTEVTGKGAPSGRVLAATVWTGSRVIVWGGGPSSAPNAFTDGASYTPESGAWTPIATPPGGSPGRRQPIAVWTGSRMLVWGGEENGQPVPGGAAYDPATDAWTALDTQGAPSPRSGVAWAWSGTTLFLFGGRIPGAGVTAEGYAYSAESGQWSALPSSGAPSPRADAFTAWTGSEFFVWGGRDESGNSRNTGARYDPTTERWSGVTSDDAPSSRSAPAGRTGWAVPLGSGVLVAGGLNNGEKAMTDGRHYDPVSDTWVATLPDWPSGASHEHGAAIFTGAELILWSGLSGGSLVADGERYKP